jgi:hypothetical protein
MHHRLAATLTVTTHILRQRLARLRREPDAGLTTAEYLMWIAIIAAIVVAVGITVNTLFTTKANGLNLN